MWRRYFARNLTSRAPCCAANTPQWIIPEASPEVSSLETLVELVRGAVSSTERHNIAAPPYSNYWKPRRSPVPHVHLRQQPDADIQPLDQAFNGGGRRDEAKQESKFLL